MLLSVELPSILGTGAPESNGADLRTKGWELAATWQNRVNNDLNYSVTLALADNVSEITRYDNPTGSIDEYYVGYKIGDRWGYQTQGIFQTEDEVASAADQSQVPGGANWRPGDIRYADLNGDGEITQGDRTLDNPGDLRIIANEEPRYTFGINWCHTMERILELVVFFQGVLKREYWPPNGNWVAFYPFNAGHVEWYYVTDTWSEDQPGCLFPCSSYFHQYQAKCTTTNPVCTRCFVYPFEKPDTGLQFAHQPYPKDRIGECQGIFCGSEFVGSY